MKIRSVPDIALRDSNKYGGRYFMSLNSGKRIHGYHGEEIPIDYEVIHLVDYIYSKYNKPLLNDGKPIFEWAPGTNIDNEQNDDQD